MKPIIGITAKYSKEGRVGILSGQGVAGEEWQLISNGCIRAITDADGIPVILPVYDDPSVALEILPHLSGLLFTGGGDIDPKYYGESEKPEAGAWVPELDAAESLLCKTIIETTHMPVLGVGRGMQLINVVHGGSLYQDLKVSNTVMHKSYESKIDRAALAHAVVISPESLLHRIVYKNRIAVNSFHHQTIKEVGKGLCVSGKSEDGAIEALEGNEMRFLLGVQWRPEMLAPTDCGSDPDSRKIFHYFVQQSRKYLEKNLALAPNLTCNSVLL